MVEVDGGYHSLRGAGDARREAVLLRLGYRVVRVSAELVVREPAQARERVRDALEGG